jgi:HPr kinase/phosphorylase
LTAKLETGLQHASCVDFDGHGVLILGSSGSGKSSLALACISIGARLVGDDYVDLNVEQGAIIARPPPNIAGLIEVAKVGILKCDYIESTKLALVIDMSQAEVERLPPRRHIALQQCDIPLIYGADIPYLHSVAFQFVTVGRADV